MPYRIDYSPDVEDDAEPVVYIRAVGVKERNRVRIGKKEVEL